MRPGKTVQLLKAKAQNQKKKNVEKKGGMVRTAGLALLGVCLMFEDCMLVVDKPSATGTA